MASPFQEQGRAAVPASVHLILTDHLGLKPGRLEGDDAAATRLEDLGADSLDAVEIVMALEERFDIEISDDAAEKAFRGGEGTVGDLVSMAEAGVQRRRAIAVALTTPLEKLPLAEWRRQFRADLTSARDGAFAAAERWRLRREVLLEGEDTAGGRATLAARAEHLAGVFDGLARSQAEQLAELDAIEAEVAV